MKFSIITVCKNMGDELRETIESVKAQTFRDFEYLVVDGESTDNTLKVVKDNRRKIDKFVSEPDRGIYEAMNKGVRMATGDYIYFLNAGDVFFKNDVLKKVSEKLDGCDIFYGNVWAVGDNKSLLKFNNINRWFLVKNSICHQALFAKRSLFDKHGFFEEEYQIAGDYDWFVKLWLDGEVVKKYVDVDVAYFQLTGKSSNDKYRKLVKDECWEVRRKYFSNSECWRYWWLAKFADWRKLI